MKRQKSLNRQFFSPHSVRAELELQHSYDPRGFFLDAVVASNQYSYVYVYIYIYIYTYVCVYYFLF